MYCNWHNELQIAVHICSRTCSTNKGNNICWGAPSSQDIKFVIFLYQMNLLKLVRWVSPIGSAASWMISAVLGSRSVIQCSAIWALSLNFIATCALKIKHHKQHFPLLHHRSRGECLLILSSVSASWFISLLLHRLRAGKHKKSSVT